MVRDSKQSVARTYRGLDVDLAFVAVLGQKSVMLVVILPTLF